MRLWMFDLLTGEVGRPCSSHCRSGKVSQVGTSIKPQPQSPTPHTSPALNCASSSHHYSGMGSEGSSSNNCSAASVGEGVSVPQRESRDRSADERENAAALIQRNYRGYRERRQMRGIGLSPATRWSEAIKELNYREKTRPTSRQQDLASGDERARARQNWQRISAIAGRAGADDSDDETEGEEGMSPEDVQAYRRRKSEARAEREKTAKQMDLQYWLELVDEKHRYGSHLRAYHQEWLKSDTHENFFYWLDHGSGKHLDLPLVSREKLESNRVRYLSREERQNYLVKIDKEGRLCWARNGMRITTSTAYKDSVDGIVPKDDTEHKPWALPVEEPGSFTSDESSTISTGHLDHTEGQHYVNHDLKNARGIRKLKHVSAATILNQLLQKSVKPNSWIFVADTSFRLYVGIKQSGTFQHSSFLRGSRISAAGLIKIKDGQLRKLSPLSGHYRPPTRNFRQFVHSLKDAGVDMSHVSISRSYAILVGLEMYVRTRKKIKHGLHHVEKEKEKVLHPEDAKKREEALQDKSQSAAKERKALKEEEEQQKEHKRKNSLSFRIMNKLRSRTSSSASLEKEVEVPEGSSGTDASAPRSVKHEDPESGIPPEGKR
ncbi:uncharacterized protein PV09_01761 [Verruconis gallopava]|uniref:IQ domain-containing protein IQM6 n=1 Tax=Verruconis gallopava TaxID=253628 RepID=A0A0D2B9B6_9PEZI|nr:uncharacterized protein PV09_01761 [Verruconis gallopava]KIW07844.1 hypothetical protein PV09_01761 [Verruconis gallopava]